MARTVVIIQARLTSTRLPGKVLLPLAGAPMLQRVVERARLFPGADDVCVAVPEGPSQLPLRSWLAENTSVRVVTGPEHDVLHRYTLAAASCAAETIVRVTSDCPFLDPAVSGAVIAAQAALGSPCARSAIEVGFPHGFDTEVFTIEALRAADSEAQDPFEREHVTPFFWRRPERFATVFLDYKPNRRNWRLTVDNATDYEFASEVYNRLYPKNPIFGMADLERLFHAEPELLTINAPARAAAPLTLHR